MIEEYSRPDDPDAPADCDCQKKRYFLRLVGAPGLSTAKRNHSNLCMGRLVDTGMDILCIIVEIVLLSKSLKGP